jgi:hypothetical protein
MELGEQGFQQMSPVPIGKVIIWVTLWPLIGAEIAAGQVEEAIQHVKVLIGPTQQPQPGPVQIELDAALQAWEGCGAEAAIQHLFQASQLALQCGYV